jgi:hypothetical protein
MPDKERIYKNMKNREKEHDMTRRMFIGMLVCSAMVLGAVQVHGEDIGPGRWWRSPDFVKDINLTDKEKQALDGMFAKNRNELIDLRSDL